MPKSNMLILIEKLIENEGNSEWSKEGCASGDNESKGYVASNKADEKRRGHAGWHSCKQKDGDGNWRKYPKSKKITS